MRNLEKALVGAVGGLAAVTVKFLGQDYDFLVENIYGIAEEKKLSLIFGYAVLTPILMFLGGLIAWASDEVKRFKLLAIAVAAPALVTAWSGGEKLSLDISSTSLFISEAIAADSQLDPDTGYEISEIDNMTAGKTTPAMIKEGIGLFFGYNKTPKKYLVIVGSFKDKVRAQNFVEQINAENDALDAYVGSKNPQKEYYPVIAGGLHELSAALELKNRVNSIDAVDGAFLSAYSFR